MLTPQYKSEMDMLDGAPDIWRDIENLGWGREGSDESELCVWHSVWSSKKKYSFQ